MAKVAVVDGVVIMLYENEHPPPHFHAKIAEFQAVIDIKQGRRCARQAAAEQIACRPRSDEVKTIHPSRIFRVCSGETQNWAYPMTELLPRITRAEPIINGVLKIVFTDGYEGVVDLRPVIAKRGVFEWVADTAHFADVRVDEYGHSLGWIDGDGYEIDLSADGLRRDCERQTEIHKLMVV